MGFSRVSGRDDGLNQGRKPLVFPDQEFIVVDERVITTAQVLLQKYELSPATQYIWLRR
jgi:hypothetical protein